MAIIRFPKNPEDGQLFELVQGVYYKYDARTKSWVLITVDEVKLATPLSDGLMSKDDLVKLNSIIVPPPQSTLKGEDCNLTFKGGTIDLYSTDDSITIDKDLNFADNTSKPWQIHENTVGYNFKLNIEQFINEINERGKIKKVQIAGPEGPKGRKGEKGVDKLDTGPAGEKGEPGANSPFAGTVIQEILRLDVDEDLQNRAIVDITSDEDTNTLTVTRANIGNPDACPKKVKPKNFQSPWLLVIDKQEGKITRKFEPTDDCEMVCRVCVSQLYYLDVTSILQKIRERFDLRLEELRYSKERVVRRWIKTMATIFNDQKYALCCALENCKSKYRNQDVRRYIEQSRIAAAQSDHSLVISSSKEDRIQISSDDQTSCEKSDPVNDPSDGRVIYGEECDEYLATVELDARIHNLDPRSNVEGRWLDVRLPPGEYFAEVIDCCANFSRSLPPPLPPQPTPIQSGTPAAGGGSTTTVANIIGNYSSPQSYVPVGRPAMPLWNNPLPFRVPMPSIILPRITSSPSLTSQGQSQYPSTIVSTPSNVSRTQSIVPGTVSRNTPSNINYQTQSISSQNKFTGRVAMLHNALVPGVGTGEDKAEQKVTEIPNLGFFNDLSAGRNAYIGLSTLFSHAGGSLKIWIPDPDKVSNNNDGGITIGIRSKKCVEVVEDTATETDLPIVYVYRDDLTPENLIGQIEPYIISKPYDVNYDDLASENGYGIGPVLEELSSKAFFVHSLAEGDPQVNDGTMAFYWMHNSLPDVTAVPPGSLPTNISAYLEVEGFFGEAHRIDDGDEGVQTEPRDPGSSVAWQFDWRVGAEDDPVDGFIMRNVPLDPDAEWLITLDDLNFGSMTRFVAINNDDSEIILSQGVNGAAMPSQTAYEPFLLCRALRRGCNVPDGFNGRYSLGVINRVKGKAFRICRNVPEIDFTFPQRRAYTYAPQPYPCGASLCDIKHQLVTGSCGDILDANFEDEENEITGKKVDIVFLVDQSGSMQTEFEFLADKINELIDFIENDEIVEIVRVGLVTYGQGPFNNQVNRGKAGWGDEEHFGMQHRLTEDADAVKAVLSTIKANGGPKEPGHQAIEWTADNANWDSEAIKMIILFTDENADRVNGYDITTVNRALKRKKIIFNAVFEIDSVNERRDYGQPDDIDNPSAGGTGLAYENGGSVFNIADLRDSVADPTNDEAPTGVIYDQPFRDVRLGVGSAMGGTDENPYEGFAQPRTYELQDLRSTGFHVITGTIRDYAGNIFRGALVHLTSSVTGENNVIMSTITDDNGTYIFQVPVNLFPTTAVTFRVSCDLYAIQLGGEWLIDNPKTQLSGSAESVYISGGGITTYGIEDIWEQGDSDTIAVTDGTPFSIRGLYEETQQTRTSVVINTELILQAQIVGGNAYLTDDEAANVLITFTGNYPPATNIVFPVDKGKKWTVTNNTSKQLILKGQAGTGVLVESGNTINIKGNGNDIVKATAAELARKVRTPIGYQRISGMSIKKIGGANKVAMNLEFSKNGTNFSKFRVRMSHGLVQCAPDVGAVEAFGTFSDEVVVGDLNAQFIEPLGEITTITSAGTTRVTAINGGGVTNLDVVASVDDMEFFTALFNDCGVGGFFQVFKNQKLREIRKAIPGLSGNCAVEINGGPSPVYVKVDEIPMAPEAFLNGRLIAVEATLQALPGTMIRAAFYDRAGRGVVMRGKTTSVEAVWQTLSWQRDSIDHYVSPYGNDDRVVAQFEQIKQDLIDAGNPRAQDPRFDTAEGRVELMMQGFSMKFRDLGQVAFEFINPDTGVIAYFANVRVAVEYWIHTPGAASVKHIDWVDISNFEPWGEDVGIPGEIPLVAYSGNATEEDFSAYLENWWSIVPGVAEVTGGDCTFVDCPDKELCPDCEVTSIDLVTGSGGGVTRHEIVCTDTQDINVPLNKYIFTTIGPEDSCLMHWKQVEWYERGWMISACCGARVEVGGVEWLVVKRSIGIDTTCGGGESESTKCIQKFIDNGDGHPAIAWPTGDGEEFLGRPTSGFARFIKDPGLSEAIKEAISKHQAIALRGDLTAANASDRIPFILFPAST